MEIKFFKELVKMNKEDVKFYSRVVANHFFRRNVQLRRITDEPERNRQKLLIETESDIFSRETKKYLDYLKLQQGVVPKRRYSI